MAAPTEHQVCLVLFAKNTCLKTRAGYHRRDAGTAVRTSSLSNSFERVPTANRQALSLRASRAPALRAFLGGLSIIVTEFQRLVLGTNARSASRKSPSPYPTYPASTAGHGRRRVGSVRKQSERFVRLPAATCSALAALAVWGHNVRAV
jgi:hypothetical protein